jgi:predicted NBD/HSP70 family sugar kinase
MSLYAGFDLGGTQLKYGLIDSKGKIPVEEKTATPPSIQGLIQLLERVWNALKSKEKDA